MLKLTPVQKIDLIDFGWNALGLGVMVLVQYAFVRAAEALADREMEKLTEENSILPPALATLD